MRRLSSLLTKDLSSIALIVTCALCLGLLINQFRDDPLDWVYQTKEERIMTVVRRQKLNATPEPSVAASVAEYISLEDLKRMINEKSCLILDARPEVFHRIGHIPGALSLPRDSFKNAYASLQTTLEAYKNRQIVVYCSAVSCGDSDLVRKALVALGYTKVSILKGGWAVWRGEGEKFIEEGP